MEAANFHEKSWNIKKALIAPVVFASDSGLSRIKLMFRKYLLHTSTTTFSSKEFSINTPPHSGDTIEQSVNLCNICFHKRLSVSIDQSVNHVGGINYKQDSWSLKSLLRPSLASPAPLLSFPHTFISTSTPTPLQNSNRSGGFYALSGTNYAPSLTDGLTNNQIIFVISSRIEPDMHGTIRI